jgi:hypothetical protein
MHDVVDSSHPDPGKGKDPRNDPGGCLTPAIGKDASENAEEICDDLCGPYGCIVGPEDVEELLSSERHLPTVLLL